MTGLEFIRKCEEHDFVELFINFYSADELKTAVYNFLNK